MNTRVLAFLSSVAGDALTRHLSVILPAMMSALKEKLGTSEEQLASSTAQLFVVTGCLKIVHQVYFPAQNLCSLDSQIGCLIQSISFSRMSLFAWWHIVSQKTYAFQIYLYPFKSLLGLLQDTILSLLMPGELPGSLVNFVFILGVED